MCADEPGEQAQSQEEGGPGSMPRSYVLKPIDGRLTYLRRGKDVRQSEEEAIQEADITLESISLHLSSALPPYLARLNCMLEFVTTADEEADGHVQTGFSLRKLCMSPAGWLGLQSSEW